MRALVWICAHPGVSWLEGAIGRARPTRRRVAVRPRPAGERLVTNPPADSALLDRFLRDGDDTALQTLVARVVPTLYRVARALTAWRVLGAQTVVERAWRAALARAEEVAGDVSLRRLLLDEVVRCATAAGDSPRPRYEEEPQPRAAAMRAVALLPMPPRAVYVLHEIAGAGLDTIATVLAMPEPQVRAELWHARLAVETLGGEALAAALDGALAGAAAHDPAGPADPTAASPGADTTGERPVPVFWQEPVPAELVERMLDGARHRRSLAASRRTRLGLPLPIVGRQIG
jgi:DNA-directed RNA polymerase specialized sigma24 family protein